MPVSRDEPSILQVDARDRIIEVNDAWLEFALANDAPGLCRERVIGASLWDFITDLDVGHLYRLLFQRVRQTGVAIRFPFRCDAPAERRQMGMSIRPLPGNGIELCTSVTRLERRPAVNLLAAHAVRSDRSLALCSWCKKVQLGERHWVEVEEAVVKLGLVEASIMPRLDHVTCPACYGEIMQELE